eukprot:4964450-Pyramimonas_sp.AAC.1
MPCLLSRVCLTRQCALLRRLSPNQPEQIILSFPLSRRCIGGRLHLRGHARATSMYGSRRMALMAMLT